MRKGLFEILDEFEAAPTKSDKIDVLKRYDSAALRTFFHFAFDSRIKWLLPKGSPPFKTTDPYGTEGMLLSQVRRLYLFVEGGNPNLTQPKREALFIGALESLHPKDAELLIAAKDRKLPTKGLTPAIINEAFPGTIMSKTYRKRRSDEDIDEIIAQTQKKTSSDRRRQKKEKAALRDIERNVLSADDADL